MNRHRFLGHRADGNEVDRDNRRLERRVALARLEEDEDHWADDNDPEDRNGDEGDQSKHQGACSNPDHSLTIARSFLGWSRKTRPQDQPGRSIGGRRVPQHLDPARSCGDLGFEVGSHLRRRAVAVLLDQPFTVVLVLELEQRQAQLLDRREVADP
jgi:hypothetical protein